MIFIVFDIEVIFLYPWAMVFRELGTYGLVAIGIFSFAVFESFVYLIGNGALEWDPSRRSLGPTCRSVAPAPPNRRFAGSAPKVAKPGSETPREKSPDGFAGGHPRSGHGRP